jgi:D-3-phosphoglycerate dehydrogenase
MHGPTRRHCEKNAMKALFIDCNDQLAPVFARVHRADDPVIDVNLSAFTSTDLPRLLDGVAVCLDDHSYLSTEAIARCRDLRHVVFLGTGAASYMNVAALCELGITVHTIKGYGDTAVAEHTIALIFACARDLVMMDRQVARIASGIGMNVIAWTRTARPDAGVALVALDALLAQADVISLHLALTDETRCLLDAQRLARIKPGGILVNTARGGLVDEAALIAALASGRLRHAGLDVFHDEPLRPDHPLATLPNVTLSAHAAFRTREASETLIRRAIDIVGAIVRSNDGGR